MTFDLYLGSGDWLSVGYIGAIAALAYVSGVAMGRKWGRKIERASWEKRETPAE